MSRWKEGLKEATSLFEAAAWRYTVRVRCLGKGCEHRAVFDAHALWWLFRRKGWDDALWMARKRFRCLRCASTDVALELVRDRPTVTRLPMPDEREWKRIVNRYRG